MRAPIKINGARPIGLLGVTKVFVRAFEPNVGVLTVLATRPIYFDTGNAPAQENQITLIERGDHGTGQLVITLAEPFGIVVSYLGIPYRQHDGTYATSLVFIGLDLVDPANDAPVCTLWEAT